MVPLRRRYRCLLFILAALVVPACHSGDDGAPGPTGPVGPPGVVIQTIVADPPVLRPGETTTVTVSAEDGAGGPLTVIWSATAGVLGSTIGNPVTWTAPGTVGSYVINVTVTNASGSSASGAASVLVSVSPSGPVITSVSPSEAGVGSEIRVTGIGFGSTQGANSLQVGGAAATVLSWSDTDIRAVIPAAAQNGRVQASVGGAAGSPGQFYFLWSAQNPLNVPISQATDSQENHQLVSDGEGGAIVVWQDARNGVDYDIYVQRVSAAGVVLWASGGVPLCQATGHQEAPQLVSDGAGGAIIVWQDRRTGTSDIFAQRVNAAGAVQWTTDGTAISQAPNAQTRPQLVSDGAGGAIIVWQDRSGLSEDIFAQRVNAAGAAQWATNGTAISQASGDQESPQIVTDGAGGAIIAWRNLDDPNGEVLAQRVDASGNALWAWAPTGVFLVVPGPTEAVSQLVSDGAGGAIIAYEVLFPADYNVYVQRVNAAGVTQWGDPTLGVAVTQASGDQRGPQIASDGAGGVIVVWQDLGNGTDSDIYAQRVSATGVPQWTADGVPVAQTPGGQFSPQISADGVGGAIVAWSDLRNGVDLDVFAQRMNSAGIPQWPANGAAISQAANGQESPRLIAGDMGGAIIVWRDSRNGNVDIFAQGISPSGRQ